MNQIFDIKINVMDNVDLDIINSIEEKCFKGKGLSQNELDYYLNYVVYQTREILALNKNKELGHYSFDFCGHNLIGRRTPLCNQKQSPTHTRLLDLGGNRLHQSVSPNPGKEQQQRNLF